MEATRSFGAELASPAAARNFVHGFLDSVDARTSETVLLLTSELVTNSVLHARTDCEVTVAMGDGHIRVMVKDGNSRLPQPCITPTGATSGHGLHLVEALCRAWGVERGRDGKAVWFEIETTNST